MGRAALVLVLGGSVVACTGTADRRGSRDPGTSDAQVTPAPDGGTDADTPSDPPDGSTPVVPPQMMPPVANPGVPDSSHCAPVADFPDDVTQAEDEVLQLVNMHRARGADCGSEGSFGPADPLTMDPALRCSSRLHSLDMAQRSYFSHNNPDGESAGDRMSQASYRWRGWGENIARGQRSPESVIDSWMNSDGHCSNIMNPSWVHIGVGLYDFRWTQNFARPR
ncbi:MAG: CAP domain-containing protein [Myxococcota bacterium]